MGKHQTATAKKKRREKRRAKERSQTKVIRDVIQEVSEIQNAKAEMKITRKSDGAEVSGTLGLTLFPSQASTSGPTIFSSEQLEALVLEARQEAKDGLLKEYNKWADNLKLAREAGHENSLHEKLLEFLFAESDFLSAQCDNYKRQLAVHDAAFKNLAKHSSPLQVGDLVYHAVEGKDVNGKITHLRVAALGTLQHKVDWEKPDKLGNFAGIYYGRSALVLLERKVSD